MNKKHFTFVELLVAFLFFLMLSPHITWWMKTMYYIEYFLLFIVLLNIDLERKHNIPLMILFLAVLAIVPVSHGMSFFGFVPYGALVVIPFMKVRFANNVYQLFKKIMVFVTSMSLIMWLLVVPFGLDLPHSIIDPLNAVKSYKYLSYPFLVVPQSHVGDILSFVRFCGVFDEPGAIGTYSLIFLYVSKFNMKDYGNIILLIAGLLSFSLFFYVGFTVFFIIKVFTTPNLKKYRFWSIVAVVVLFVLTQTVPILNEIIGIRFKYDAEMGTFVGNNRNAEALGEYIESIRGTAPYYWGDTQDVIEQFSYACELNNSILRYGVVFVIAFFVFFFIYSSVMMKRQWRDILLFMLLVFLTFYQRPSFVSPTYLFLFSSVVFVWLYENDTKTFTMTTQNLKKRKGFGSI